MAKFVSTLLLVVVFITVQGLPVSYDEILSAARAGQWSQVQEFQNEQQTESNELAKEWKRLLGGIQKEIAKATEVKPALLNSVRELKPPEDGHVYGEAAYAYHSASNINGKTSEEKGGHKVINNDGKVKEFDFIPSTELSPIRLLTFKDVPELNEAARGVVFNGDSEGAFESKSSEAISHQTVFSKNGNIKQFNKLLGLNLPLALPTLTGVRDLKPLPGVHSASSINGHSSENHSKQEFDFIPSPGKSPLSGENSKELSSHKNIGRHKSKVNSSENTALKRDLINRDIDHNYHSDTDVEDKKLEKPLTFTNVRELKPAPGGQVYGEAEYTFHSASNINGKTAEDHAGHKVINNNGQVHEYDFTPKATPDFLPLPKLHFPSLLHKDISARLKSSFNN